MEKKLKSLEDYNAQQREYHFNVSIDKSVLNGIACPKCGEEMMDSNPMVVLTSYPPQKNVNCSKCDYVGYRIA